MHKNHSILKKGLVICLVVLGVGITAYLLLNWSGDNVDKVNNITSEQSAKQPAAHNVVHENDSHSWSHMNTVIKLAVFVAYLVVIGGIIYHGLLPNFFHKTANFELNGWGVIGMIVATAAAVLAAAAVVAQGDAAAN